MAHENRFSDYVDLSAYQVLIFATAKVLVDRCLIAIWEPARSRLETAGMPFSWEHKMI